MAQSSSAEIRKNARILGRIARNPNSVFAKKEVPLEMLSKIAADTTTSARHTEVEREKIALAHLGRPKKQGSL